MNKILLAGTALAMAMAAGSASAANSLNAGTMGLNIGFTSATAISGSGSPADFLISGKYLIAKDTALLAGFGFQSVDTGAAANATSTDIGFMVGMRKYMKTDDFAPFIGGRLQYLSTRQGANDVTDFALIGEAGAEYFFGKQFSLEGSVGFGYGSAEAKPVGGGTSVKGTGFGTKVFNLGANFYF